jgi:Kdo2-lipid IVA lauroyltransferase/acyltransferase
LVVRRWIEYGAALAAVKSLEYAPRSAAYVLARFYTRLLDLAAPRLRRVAMRNLTLALPEKTHTEHRQIADDVFRSIARLLVTFAKFPGIGRGNVAQWVRCEGYEHVEAALARGRGVLFATAHLGNWELSAFAHGLFFSPMHVLVRPLDNPLIDGLVERRRTLSGNHVIDKRNSAREILSALAANEAVGILIDQNSTPDQGAFVDFFGTPACAATGIAKIAAHSGAAVIPGFALWNGRERRSVLRFYPPVEITGSPEEDTARLQKRLEAVIREYPGQWLWIHRRWKTRPSGQPPLY